MVRDGREFEYTATSLPFSELTGGLAAANSAIDRQEVIAIPGYWSVTTVDVADA